jgi:metallo-beta-lactamase class B
MGPAIPQPRRDQVAVDGQAIVLGDAKILPVLIPGHTPGALALIFPVFDRGRRHTAGIFGGTVLSAGFVSADGLRQYIDSVRRYAAIAGENHVDVEIQNHPLMDGFAAKLEQLKARAPQAPHPFVVGEAAYAAFLNVMAECAQAQLLRKAK